MIFCYENKYKLMKECVGLGWVWVWVWVRVVRMCVEERRNTGFNLYLPTKSFDYCVVCGMGSRVDD